MTSTPDQARADAARAEADFGASIGQAIRDARTAKALSMRALARDAEISQPFLSQIESGQTMPSLVTLYRLATALGLPPSELLPPVPNADPDDVHISRGRDAVWRPISEAENSGTTRMVWTGAANVQENVFEPGQYTGDWFETDGEVTALVIEGEITAEIEGRGSYDLGPGDAISHPGALRNRWTVRGDGRVRVVLVYSPGA